MNGAANSGTGEAAAKGAGGRSFLAEVKVQHRVYIDAPAVRVFRQLTSSEGWCGWFATKALVEARPGGKIRFEWVEFGAESYTAADEGRVLECVENRRFSFTWNPGPRETRVVIRFERRGRGCLLAVEETGYDLTVEDVEVALQVAAGWGEALTLLKFYLEAGMVYGAVPSP